MKGIALIGILVVCLAATAHAQSGRYLVQLNNKGQNPFSLTAPQQFLSARSIERRTRYHIPYDSTDLPVTPAYLDSIRSISGVTILNVSRWLNQVSVQVSNTSALDSINRFSFVQSTRFIASRTQRSNRAPEGKVSKMEKAGSMQSVDGAEQAFKYGAATAQVNIHNGAFLHNLGLQGQNMILSLLDAGFYQYTSLRAFDSVNKNGQVLGTWDFVARDTSVAEDYAHGMHCFSIIAANVPDSFVGTAPEASFYLFRTEDAGSEYPIEEHNWVCAAERVDSAGGDVISSSLGYNHFNDATQNHQYSDMNGNTTTAAQGADLAAKKGILVVCAAGNEGESAWKYIMTPADADSILAVGAVNAAGDVAPFSSYGPSADGQVKPDVVSIGVNTVIEGTNNTIVSGNGTSYACPNMAGLATCLWQGFPEYNNMKIIEILRRASNHFDTPNVRTGYGIPDMKKAVLLLLEDYATAAISTCKTITWRSKDVSSMRYEIERQKPGEASFIKIGEQPGGGLVFQTHNYQFTDPEITAADGAVRYRIRQVIDTTAIGFSAFYIDTLTVSLALTCTPVPAAANNIQIIPNPVQQSFQVKMNSGVVTNLQFVVVNAIGQTVYSERTSKPEGLSVFTINTPGLVPGAYFLMIFDAGKRLATKPFLKL